MRDLRPVVLGLLILVPLTACTSPGPGPGPTRGSSAPTASASPSASSTASTSSTTVGTPVASAASGSTGDPNRPRGQCADAVIRVTLSMPKGAAGSFDQDVTFTNKGATPCVLRGAPGLSVVGDGNGTQLGAAAVRDQSDAATVRLSAHGGSAYAPLTGTELGAGSEGAKHCTGGVRRGNGYRIYPPHSTRAYFVRDANAFACPGGGTFLRVAVVRAVGSP